MKLDKLAVTLFVLTIASGLTNSHLAQAASDQVAKDLKSWDTDSDGTLDLIEVKGAAAVKFDILEKDNDGTVSLKELSSTKIDKKTFTKADTDKDGTLSKDEFLTIAEERFKAADTDNDGTVSVTELKTKTGEALLRILK